MKNIWKYLYLIAILLFAVATGCSEKDERIPEIETELTVLDELPSLTKSEVIALAVQKKGSYAISESEAVEILMRGIAFDEVESPAVNIVNTVLKKNAGTGKDMYYEFVIESEKGTGFSIVSADERIPELLSYSEVGSISDTSFNKSMKFCMDMLDQYVLEQTKDDLDIDALVVSANKKIDAKYNMKNNVSSSALKWLPPFDPNDPRWIYSSSYYYTTYSTKTHTVSFGFKWHQQTPFNDLLPVVNGGPGGRAYAGCGTIAVAQIMACWERPISYSWSTIKSDPHSTEMKNLIKDIFHSIIISYNSSGSSTNITNARSFLISKGFSVGAVFDYQYIYLWDALQYGPTYMRGQTSSNAGHAWVVDGAHKTSHVTENYYYFEDPAGKIHYHTETLSLDFYQFRFAWGWFDTTVNTWYNSNIFQPSGMPNNNYNKDVKFIRDVRNS